MSASDDEIIAGLNNRALPAKASKLATGGFLALAAVFLVIVWRKYIRN